MTCTGACDEVCGSIAMSRGEFGHLTKVTGKKPQMIGDRCNYLTKDGCAAYDDRPAVCRLFGGVETMQCPYCVPEKLISEGEARKIMDDVSNLFGERRRSFVEN